MCVLSVCILNFSKKFYNGLVKERNEKENVGVLVVKEHFSLLVTPNFPRQAGKDS